MNGPLVAVIETGLANTASVLAALRRAGAQPELTTDPQTVAAAPYAVLPGVGAFGAGMDTLRRARLIEPLQQRIAAGRATLCVCLGMQLLCAASDESSGVAGLEVIPATVRRFGSAVRVPQLGWNTVTAGPGAQILRDGSAYFANSFRLTEQPGGWIASRAEYDGPFVAALERGAVVACQFHPELSGAWGAGLLARWLARGAAAEGV